LEILTGSLPGPEELTARIDEWHEPDYRAAALYQKLICGRASEAVGKYQPQGTHAKAGEPLGTPPFLGSRPPWRRCPRADTCPRLQRHAHR